MGALQAPLTGLRVRDQPDVAEEHGGGFAGLVVDLPLEEGTGTLAGLPLGEGVEDAVVLGVPGAVEPAAVPDRRLRIPGLIQPTRRSDRSFVVRPSGVGHGTRKRIRAGPARPSGQAPARPRGRRRLSIPAGVPRGAAPGPPCSSRLGTRWV